MKCMDTSCFILLVTDIVKFPLVHVHVLDVHELRETVTRLDAGPERGVVHDHRLSRTLHFRPDPRIHSLPAAARDHKS